MGFPLFYGVPKVDIFVPIHPGQKVSGRTVRHVLSGLRECSLPLSSWIHGAHLCAGVAKAEKEMPGLIKASNIATGRENTETAGYHHSITIFYLRVIHKRFASGWSNELSDLVNDLLMFEISGNSYPLHYYSTETLFSIDARQAWVEPDLQSL